MPRRRKESRRRAEPAPYIVDFLRLALLNLRKIPASSQWLPNSWDASQGRQRSPLHRRYAIRPRRRTVLWFNRQTAVFMPRKYREYRDVKSPLPLPRKKFYIHDG